ncbi:hypothetical protein [Nostoc sp. FACHB-280]|uniref:slr1601 family putative cell division protein n=1 Tax=Nostoc sp. FACHB-280 TaxID=2692839 RepID=UPI00168A8893|nr:hypothetical protein [Nostoc sp. FACHB-280]MBD2493469.1 hypothetical protein [Nostoc sp. FACHB-280]
MNAFQPSRQPLQPIQQPRTIPRPKRHLRQRSHQIMAIETTVKIGVNLAILGATASAITQLLPYHWSQQERLREVRTEVKIMEGRVSTLQAEFVRNFDPRQTKAIAEQQGYRFAPNQRPIVLMNQDGKEIDVIHSLP